jgi:hypothetical protein
MAFDFKKFESVIIPELELVQGDFNLIALNNVKAALSRRIFQQGKATDDSEIGEYSEATQLLREQEGLQIEKVDLQFTGNLFRSITVGLDSENQIALGIEERTYTEGSDTAKVASANEERFGKEIFSPSEKEIDKAIAGAMPVLSRQLDKAIDKALNAGLK